MRRHFAKRHCAGLLIAKNTIGFTTAARTVATDRTDTTVTEPTNATSSVEEARKRWQKRLKELKHEQQQQVAKNKDDVTVLSSTEPTSSAAADGDDDVALTTAHSAVAHQERVIGLHFGKKRRVVRAAETIALHRQWFTACVEGEQLLKKLLAPMEKELRRLEERLEMSSSSRKQMMLRPKDVLSIRRTFLDVQAQLHTSIELHVQTNASDKNNKSSISNGGAATSSSSPRVQQTLRTALGAQRFAQLKRDVNHLVQQLSSSQQQQHGDEAPQQNRQAASQPFFLLRAAVQDVLVPQVKRLEDLQYRLLMRKYPVAVSKLERAMTGYSKNTARRKVLHKNSGNEQGAQSHHQLAVAPLTFVQNGRVLRSLMVMERQREQFMEKILASYDDRTRAAKRREMKWERTVAYYEEKKRRLLKAIRPQMATPREMATLERSMKEIDVELEKAREALLGEEASGTLAKHVAAELREIETDRQLLLVQPVAKPYVSVRMWTLLEESLDVVAAPYLPTIVPSMTSTMELDGRNVENRAMLSQNAEGSATTPTKSIPASGSELATVEDGTSTLSTWDADGTIANTTPRAPSPAATASPAARRLFIQCSYAIVDLLLVLQRHQHGIASFNSDVKQKKDNGRKMDDDDGEEDQEDPSVLLNAVDTGIFERYPRQITTTTTASSTKHNKKKRKKNKKEDGDAKKATQSSSVQLPPPRQHSRMILRRPDPTA